MTYALWLDDYRPVSPEFIAASGGGPVVIAVNYEQFVQAITEHGCPQYISFDHDLADAHYGGDFSGPEMTGMACAEWLVDWILDDPTRLLPNFRFNVHSMNPAGAENIRGLLNGFFEFLKRNA